VGVVVGFGTYYFKKDSSKGIRLLKRKILLPLRIAPSGRSVLENRRVSFEVRTGIKNSYDLFAGK